ncbi:ornithine cyclodeaminase family protein [Macrococcus epidermidis]|uniref:ornithine cyclodeaminase family protein n=1 Tax=Macrococcus epidermidis TaxID=1902580 RepID=UPI001EF20FC0|nr:ornithine cyclodeaminase family protein [Macrococcus epidermidis]MCG7421152.1 ornithine cyclodeaminase family protein [Macrococcus epidermidis]
MQFYSDETIEQVYKMRHAIADVKAILNDLNDNKIIMKERTVLEVPGTQNTMLYMPCINTKSNYSILKTISIFPENKSKPVSQGVTLLSDLKDGTHIANLESSYLTRLRTGAMSAIATDKLAKQDAEVLCVIGTGGMAFEQVLGVIEVRNIKTINLYNRTYEKAKDFKQKLEDFGVTSDIQVFENVTEAIKNADIINCATRSEESVFDHKDLQSSVHINGVGSYLPKMREIDTISIKHADTIVLDDLHGAQHEAGEFIQAEQDGHFDFNQATLLKDLTDKNETEGVTIFKSVGAAYYDLAVTAGAYELLNA